MSIDPAVSGNSKYTQVMQATSAAKARLQEQMHDEMKMHTKSKPDTIPGLFGSNKTTTYPKMKTFSLGGKIDIRA